MKTVDEAILAAVTVDGPAGEPPPTGSLAQVNLEDLARDCMASQLTRDYVKSMASLAASQSVPKNLDWLRSACMASFIAGIRVGQEMGTTEVTHV